MILELPYPPTVNTYWRSNRGRTHISAEGKIYRRNVEAAVFGKGRMGPEPLRVVIAAHPPDRRSRDLDNLTKALLDALEHAGVYDSDNQIADLRIHRCEVVEGGKVIVRIEKIET